MVCSARGGRGFVDGTGWLTFGQLVDLLGGARRVGRRACPPLMSRVVISAAARALGPGPFGAYVQEPAFARAAAELFADLKAGCLSPPELHLAVAHFPAARIERARYLAKLYAEYEHRLGQLRLADREDEVSLALASLRTRGLPPPLASLAAIEIAGLHDFPASRRRLLLELAAQCDRSGVRFHLEVPAGCSAAVDAAVDPLLGDFERAAHRMAHVEVAKRDLTTERRPLAALGRHLFGEETPPPPPEPLALELVRASTARHEARTLARIAADRISDGVAPERIAIAWPELGDEAGWTVEALEELGVPVRIRRGVPLRATALGRLALDLPLLADDGFPADRVAALVASRYAPEISSAAPHSIAALLAEAGVRDDRIGAAGERGAYEVRLGALARRLEARGADARRGSVLALLERCRKLIAIAAGVPEEGRAQAMLERWWHALGELGVAKAVREPRVREDDGTPLGRAVLRAVARDQSAYEALESMVRDLGVALRESGVGSARIGCRTFHRWLLDAALDYNLAPPGPRGGAVQVVDVRELAGRTFEHVCLGGIADGRFPGRAPAHPLFPDEDRLRVNERCGRDVFELSAGEAGRRLPRRLASERLIFHLALSASVGRVTASVSAESASGSEQLPSPFWDELIRLTSVAPRAAPLWPVPPLDEVRNERELRERAALEMFAPAALRTEDPDPGGVELERSLGGEAWLQRAGTLARIEDERLRFFGDPERAPGPFSGDAGREDVRALLEARFAFGRERPLSASRLDRFGQCAFRGFLEYALHLSEPDEAGEEIDRRRRGTFWHKVLERLFPRLRERGLLRAAQEEIPDELIDEAIGAAAADAERGGPTGHPALWRIGQERARRMARGLLASSARGLPFEGLQPGAVEMSFGTPDAPEGWREIALPGAAGQKPVFVQGTIDRLDDGGGALGVVDYKSGALEKGKQLADALLSTHFQVPLYLHAARVAGHRGPLDGAWLSLKNGEVVRLGEVLEGRESLEELLAVDPEARAAIAARGGRNLATAVHGLVEGLRAGRFPARSDDCRNCSYRRVCRISDRALPEDGGNGS